MEPGSSLCSAHDLWQAQLHASAAPAEAHKLLQEMQPTFKHSQVADISSSERHGSVSTRQHLWQRFCRHEEITSSLW